MKRWKRPVIETKCSALKIALSELHAEKRKNTQRNNKNYSDKSARQTLLEEAKP